LIEEGHDYINNIMGSHQSTANQLEDKPFDEPAEWTVFSEKIVELSAGVKRNVVRWAPKGMEMKGIALICHGLHEHSLRYFKVANALTRKGYLVASIDHKGHGLSDGEKGLIDDWTVLERDFTAYANSLHAEHPGAPFYVLAHSLGTVIATLSLKNLPFVKVSLPNFG
jgi:alpha-beta hydrolase superfamily lysophospholipase